ncbi:hypothetical protein TorRG33x02_005400 [Trema orientale]|uniref:Uncharacterized protein n=1 Tax=Trema orientale TaxID=63057 RepID=A0A2P5FZX4_TREOI|nr:hypothetical protein TorRG33x02_005400 [Trema orientale]
MAAEQVQKTAPLTPIFAATFMAHPILTSETTQVILSFVPSKALRLIVSTRSSSFAGIDSKTALQNWSKSVLSSSGPNPSGIETKSISEPVRDPDPRT